MPEEAIAAALFCVALTLLPLVAVIGTIEQRQKQKARRRLHAIRAGQ